MKRYDFNVSFHLEAQNLDSAVNKFSNIKQLIENLSGDIELKIYASTTTEVVNKHSRHADEDFITKKIDVSENFGGEKKEEKDDVNVKKNRYLMICNKCKNQIIFKRKPKKGLKRICPKCKEGVLNINK